jgi:hypothetical protein
MFALRARPPALPARRSAPRRPAAPATKTPRSPNSAPLTAQALRRSIPCDRPTKREEYRAPASSARCAFFVRHSTQGRNLAPLFSYSYRLLLPQLPYFYIHAVCPGVYCCFASYCYPTVCTRDHSEGVAVRLNGGEHRNPLPALRDETLCYALRLDQLSAGPSEVSCGS